MNLELMRPAAAALVAAVAAAVDAAAELGADELIGLEDPDLIANGFENNGLLLRTAASP